MSTDHSSAFNLEHLKKEAKRLLRACRAGDPQTLASVRAVLSSLAALDADDLARHIQLADVHQAMAMQRGFASWAELTRAGDPLARLLAAVRGGHLVTFRRDLPHFNGLAATNVFAAAALGDVAALRRHLDAAPLLATTAREGWTPLDYLCSSPLARLSVRHATSLCDCAEILLAAGADPGTAVDDERLPGTPVPAIMRALLSGNMALVVILKKNNAQEPHETMRKWLADHRDKDQAELQRLFGEYFRQPEVKERMQQALEAFKVERAISPSLPHGVLPIDPREMQHLRMPNLLGTSSHLWEALLDRGYDPTAIGVTGRSALHTLVTYAPVQFVEMFLAHDVKLNVRDADGRSVIATAVRAGNVEVAELLRSRGIVDDSTPADRLIGACLADEADAAQELVARDPDVLASLARADADEFVRAAARGSINQVRLMLACGFPPDLVGESGATALQQAAWRGQVPVVELLLANGASPTVKDELYGETALAWARHGASHAQGAEGPCLQAAKLLEIAERRWRTIKGPSS